MKAKNTKKIIISVISIALAIILCITAVGAVGVVAVGTLATGAVVVGGGIIAAVIYNQPEYVAGRALLNFGDDLLARNELKPIVEALDGGSFAFSVDNIKTEAESYNYSVKGKLYFDEDEMMLKDFYLKNENVMIGGDIYISDDEMYIKETEILQDAYGVRLSELANDLSTSIFAPDSGTEYALDEDTYQALTDLSKIASSSDEMEEDAKKLSDKLTKDIWKIITEYSEVTSENTEVRLGDTVKNSRVISIQIDAHDMEIIINNVYYYLRDSGDIAEFLSKYEDSLIPVVEDVYYEHGHSSLAEAYRHMMYMAEEDVMSFSTEIRYSNFNKLELKVTTPLLFSTLLRLDVKVNDELLLTLDCGEKGIKKSNTVSLRSPDLFEIVYNVNRNDNSSTNATLDLNTYSDYSIRFFIDINKDLGIYSAGFEYPEYGYVDIPVPDEPEDWYDEEYTEGEQESESSNDVWEDIPEYIDENQYPEDTNNTPSNNDDWVMNYASEDFYTYDDYATSEQIGTVKVTFEGQIHSNKDATTITLNKIRYDYHTTNIADGYYNDESHTVTLNSEFIIDTKDEMPEKINYKTINQIAVADIENLLLRIENLY